MNVRCWFLAVLLLSLLTGCASSGWQEYWAEPGAVLLQDDFSTQNLPWPVGKTESGSAGFENGVYRVQIATPFTEMRALAGRDYQNVRMYLTVGKFTGPDATRAGLICRASERGFYFFVYTADGYAAIGWMDGETPRLLTGDTFQFSAAIHPGMAVNALRAECVGDTLRFFINDQPVAIVQHSALTHGDVGFLAGTFDQGNGDLLFDDFIVVKP